MPRRRLALWTVGFLTLVAAVVWQPLVRPRTAWAAQQKPADGEKPKSEADQAQPPVLSCGDFYDDFTSVAEGPDGSLYAAYFDTSGRG